MINFEIPGEPKSKARHRTTKTGIAYTPKKTTEYENWVRQCYCIKHRDKRLTGQIRAEIKAYFTIPKSTSKKKRIEMINKNIRPTKKPDTDNIAKIVLDSLNSIAFDDDKQVVELNVQKFYSENPRVEVELSEVS
ncbi:holliday junction resolvase [Gottschalkia purinilytica]|uniref:Holliday junction resolvase n=1 Tax=Gottschalkia purinilytica TaxID=1503 RepID=A0A0L0WED4_GOTPU|nr:RusA family crossover junction endodeoxyribonuclease [Gottschalkia purinilytica]KNF09838.1 holliday junction resolvase [Gottschalkia purinilytica]